MQSVLNIARKLGTAPICLAVALLALVCLTGCDDAEPLLTQEEMRSDPVPEHDASVFAGEWLLDGRVVVFEERSKGFYEWRKAEPTGDVDEDMPFTVKRAGDYLFLEFTLAFGPSRLHWPCAVQVAGEQLQLLCLRMERDNSLSVRHLKANGDEVAVFADGADALHDLCAVHANDKHYFAREWELSRPQPQKIARLQARAEGGNKEAAEQLAEAYAAGQIVARDDDAAQRWALIAALSGRPSSQVLLGDLVQRSATASRDGDSAEQAMQWYRRAAEQDYGPAFFKMAELYRARHGDVATAIRQYERGVELGDAKSAAALGLTYWYGDGVPRDEMKAVSYLQQSATTDQNPRVWQALADARLHAFDPSLRDERAALDAAEHLVATMESCGTFTLLAEAAHANGQWERAVENQRRAVCEGASDEAAQRQRLAQYLLDVPPR